MVNIAIFASGSGSNAEAIIRHFQNSGKAKVALIISNNKEAYVLERARHHNIDSILLSKSAFYNTKEILADLKNYKIDLIALAGFLWLIPPYLVKAYPHRIINIHPALLPSYGGKGMYGQHVHQVIYENRDEKSGITIHYVDEKYDNGQIILQKEIPLSPEDKPGDIARKVLELEHYYYPRILENLADSIES